MGHVIRKWILIRVRRRRRFKIFSVSIFSINVGSAIRVYLRTAFITHTEFPRKRRKKNIKLKAFLTTKYKAIEIQ